MQSLIPPDSIVVSDVSFRSDDPGEIVESNISFINALFEEYLAADEVSPDALRSYYVDYYYAQVNNGGFSQFVYNSHWKPRCIAYVREGITAMGANQHLELFEEGARLVEQLGNDRLQTYFASQYFGENDTRDKLNAINDQFWKVDSNENLLVANAAWLRKHARLLVLTESQMAEEARRRGHDLPDRARRAAEALADEPDYLKVIRKLCDKAGHSLVRVTAGDPTRLYGGVKTMAWHFITDKGHHHMVEARGKAIMFAGHSTTDSVCEIEALPS
jgi:hypothetical protein